MRGKKSVKDEAAARLEALMDYINTSLSHESAQGNVEYIIKGEAGNWTISLSGSVCHGYDNDGNADFRGIDELLRTDRWSGSALLEVVGQIERVVNGTKGYE